MEVRRFFKLLLSSLLLLATVARGQQSFERNLQLDCHNTDSVTKGYICNGPPRCQSYVTFRSEPPYNTASRIAVLLASNALAIASVNELSSIDDVVQTPRQLVVPVTCSCSGQYYQHNGRYTISNDDESYYSVANLTYQGLSTCQAMMSQNIYGEKELGVGSDLVVPMRCACPTLNQTSVGGVKYLLTYLVTWGDTINEIAGTFGVSNSSIMNANNITSDLIFPFNSLLIPLTIEPTSIKTSVTSPPPPSPSPPSQSQDIPNGGSSSSNKWIYVGVGIGFALLLLILVSIFLFCFRRKKSVPDSLSPKKPADSVDYSTLPGNTTSSSVSFPSSGFQYAIDSLTIYKFEDLQNATSNFSEKNKIKGSVYRGSFHGDTAAVKAMKGDVSSEINLLKKINHSNIVRLSGFCRHGGNNYLVYEYEKNSLSDWLHSEKKHETPSSLIWKQRVQIARDVADGLNYLHHYTNPPFIHKNLKSSNILLDQSFRAKISNFGLARALNGDEQRNGTGNGNDLDFTKHDLDFTKHVVGTQGYMAPEYIENGMITPKLDVFSFGVVVLELLSGREAVSGEKKEEEFLYAEISDVVEGENVREKLKDFMDTSLGNEYPLDLAFSMAQLAKICVALDLNARPSMDYVLTTLSKILSSTLDWDPSDLLDRSTSYSSASRD